MRKSFPLSTSTNNHDLVEHKERKSLQYSKKLSRARLHTKIFSISNSFFMIRLWLLFFQENPSDNYRATVSYLDRTIKHFLPSFLKGALKKFCCHKFPNYKNLNHEPFVKISQVRNFMVELYGYVQCFLYFSINKCGMNEC